MFKDVKIHEYRMYQEIPARNFVAIKNNQINNNKALT